MRHMRHKNLNYEAEMPSTFLAINNLSKYVVISTKKTYHK